MKLQLALCGLLALSFASCDNGTTTTTATTSDTTAVPPATDPNMITTTTTTTTTRPAFQPQANVKYLDVRTKKMIMVRVDTVHHYIVNTETNQPVDFIVQPGSTDTFYGRNMQMANGAINYTDWSFDEARANAASSSSMTNADMSSTSTTDNATTTTDASATNGDGSNVRKMKTNGKETKVKMDDGSKMKTNGNETKIKNK